MNCVCISSESEILITGLQLKLYMYWHVSLWVLGASLPSCQCRVTRRPRSVAPTINHSSRNPACTARVESEGVSPRPASWVDRLDRGARSGWLCRRTSAASLQSVGPRFRVPSPDCGVAASVSTSQPRACPPHRARSRPAVFHNAATPLSLSLRGGARRAGRR